MSDAELEVWDVTLRNALSMATATGTKPTAVVCRMLRRMNGEIAKYELLFFSSSGLIKSLRLISFPKAVVILLDYVNLSDVEALPVDMFSMMDALLVSSYPPPPESLAICLKILRWLGEIISAAPVFMLIQLLTTMGESLRLWIGDNDEAMLESEFDNLVRFTLLCCNVYLI